MDVLLWLQIICWGFLMGLVYCIVKPNVNKPDIEPFENEPFENEPFENFPTFWFKCEKKPASYPKLKFKKRESNVCGIYRWSENIITIYYMKGDTEEEILNTLLHEEEHWIQRMYLNNVQNGIVSVAYTAMKNNDLTPFLERINSHKGGYDMTRRRKTTSYIRAVWHYIEFIGVFSDVCAKHLTLNNSQKERFIINEIAECLNLISDKEYILNLKHICPHIEINDFINLKKTTMPISVVANHKFIWE